MVFKGYLCFCFIILYFQAALLKLFIKLVCFTVCQCADSGSCHKSCSTDNPGCRMQGLK